MSEDQMTPTNDVGKKDAWKKEARRWPKAVSAIRAIALINGILCALLALVAFTGLLHEYDSVWPSMAALSYGVCVVSLMILAFIMSHGRNWARISFTALSGILILCYSSFPVLYYVSRQQMDPTQIGRNAPWSTSFYTALTFALPLIMAIILSWLPSTNAWFRAVKERVIAPSKNSQRTPIIIRVFRVFCFLGGGASVLVWAVGVFATAESWSFLYEIWSWVNLLAGVYILAFAILIRRGKSWARIVFTALSCVVVLYDLTIMSYEMMVNELTRNNLWAWGILLLFAFLLMVALVLCWLPSVNAWFRTLEEQKRADR